MHFLISQIVGYAGLCILMQSGFGGTDAYYDHAIFLTGLTGILALIPGIWFYQKDHISRRAGGLLTDDGHRRLQIWDVLLLLGTGAALSQFGNMILGLFEVLLDYQDYQETMDLMMEGKSMCFLILCMGTIAPLAEEVIFRWLIYLRLRDYLRMGSAAVISGLIFGIYHGNPVQAVYAGVLGMIFAWLLETTGSLWTSVFLHMGANIWSLAVPEIYTYFLTENPLVIVVIMLVLLLILLSGIPYFRRSFQETGKRRI